MKKNAKMQKRHVHFLKIGHQGANLENKRNHLRNHLRKNQRERRSRRDLHFQEKIMETDQFHDN
jgi:ribosomal protein S15P/S13E